MVSTPRGFNDNLTDDEVAGFISEILTNKVLYKEFMHMYELCRKKLSPKDALRKVLESLLLIFYES